MFFWVTAWILFARINFLEHYYSVTKNLSTSSGLDFARAKENDGYSADPFHRGLTLQASCDLWSHSCREASAPKDPKLSPLLLSHSHILPGSCFQLPKSQALFLQAIPRMKGTVFQGWTAFFPCTYVIHSKIEQDLLSPCGRPPFSTVNLAVGVESY
jgi:hypothetical protein